MSLRNLRMLSVNHSEMTGLTTLIKNDMKTALTFFQTSGQQVRG